MRYPEEVIEEVRTRNDIVDVVSGYVALQRKGNYYFGLCPFHHEKSPSFSVSPGRQVYHCFGCGAGGDVIAFIMEYESYTFGEALQLLADRAGVVLPKRGYSQEEREQEDLKKTLLEINKLAANYFYHQLKQPQGKPGYDYLKGRQLSDDTIRRFGLGYSNKTSNDLYLFLKSKGYGDSLLKETGLVTIEERGSRDKFWDRVMFPIMDINNRVIGFGGRVMGEGKPKYLNSPETKLFDKSRNLFGLNYARTSRERYILICEGYMDVIAMHQAGFSNSVASLGTAFTSQQAVLLKRYTDQVILTYDSDEAGVKAALRAIPILKEVDISVKVLDMKPCKDPDELIKTLGAEELCRRIEKAKNSFLFEIDVLRRQFDMEDPEQKTRFYQETARKLLEFRESLERDNYIRAVSREQFIPYEDLKRLVERQASHFVPGSRAAGGSRPEDGMGRRQTPLRGREESARQAQRLLLVWLIEDPGLFAKIRGIVSAADFVEPLYHQVAEQVFEAFSQGAALSPGAILDEYIGDEGQYREVAALFHAGEKDSLDREEQRKAFSEIVRKVKGSSLEQARKQATSLGRLQQIIKEQAALRSLHISLDQGG